jgi:cytoskeletal protein RodZ
MINLIISTILFAEVKCYRRKKFKERSMKKSFWAPLLVLVLVTMACGPTSLLKQKATQETAVAEPSDAIATPAAQNESPTTGADESAPNIDKDALNGLNSYRSRFTMRSETADGTLVDETVIEMEETRSPKANRMTMKNTKEGNTTQFEMIQIEDKSWTKLGDTWVMSQSADEASKAFGASGFTSFMDSVTTTDSSSYKYLGQENINGINTRHYQLTMTAAQLAAMQTGSEYKNVDAQAWVAKESNLPEFMVKFTFNATGKVKDDIEGKVIWSEEVYDLNQTFTIEPPAEAGSSNGPGDVPAYEGAADLIVSNQMVSYSASADVATVAQYYTDKLTAGGWSQSENNDMGTTVMQTWQKDGQSITVIVTSKDSGGCDVVVTAAQ